MLAREKVPQRTKNCKIEANQGVRCYKRTNELERGVGKNFEGWGSKYHTRKEKERNHSESLKNVNQRKGNNRKLA